MTNVRCNGFTCAMAAWSLRQQAVAATARWEIVFVKLPEGMPMELKAAGEEYAGLYKVLLARSEKGRRLAAEWEKKHGGEARRERAKL